MHTRTNPHLWRTWRRSTLRVVVIGAIAASFMASAASAKMSEPPESREQGSYPDQPDDDGGSSGGGSSTPDLPEPDPVYEPVPGHDTSTTSTGGTWNYGLESDLIKITDRGIDFGDDNWVGLIGEPFGSGSVEWSVDDGFYSARLVGTLHLDGVSGQYGRMHVSYWNYDTRTETRHSTSRRASDNGHHDWSVDLSPLNDDTHITEVHVCTEISDNGVDFESVNCKERYLG